MNNHCHCQIHLHHIFYVQYIYQRSLKRGPQIFVRVLEITKPLLWDNHHENKQQNKDRWRVGPGWSQKEHNKQKYKMKEND